MKIGVIKERRAHEARVAVSPETVKKLIALGTELAIDLITTFLTRPAAV